MAFRPDTEAMEGRVLLSFADGNGPVVTNLAEQGVSQIVISFDGPLNPTLAQNVAEYRVNLLAPGNLQLVSTSGAADPIKSAVYNAATNQVTLNLLSALKTSECYRVFVNGTPGSGITDTSGTLIDGDNDDTAGGNFYGLIARGHQLAFTELDGERASLAVSGKAELQLWRGINGDAVQLTVSNVVAGKTTLTGSVKSVPGGSGVVVIPSIQGLTGVNNELPSSFVSQPVVVNSPAPVVATAQNLPYTLQITPVTLPSVPSIQSATSAQSNGLWLVFGGRTNGLHGFNPTGLANFPPEYQNENIYVINPTTGQTWTEAWSATGLPASEIAALSSANQESYQSGDRLYTIGGYSYDAATQDFTTYDTLSAISVSGLISAVIQNGSAVGLVKQIQDPRLAVTGGEVNTLGNRTYLVFGQDFQGSYNGNNSSGTQVYTDEVRSFHIVDQGKTLAISGYQAQRDPENFRRRDYNLVPTILPNGKSALMALGGVFTPLGAGYRTPIVIGSDGVARVDPNYQQYFSQYTSPTISLFDAKTGASATVLFGGISLYDYDFATGTLSTDPALPFVDDVTSLIRTPSGTFQEFIMPSQLPARLGAEASFFEAPGLPTYSNSVVKFDQITGPTTLGYIYGGIYSTVGDTTNQTTQTTASNLVFKVTLVPTGASVGS